MDDLDEARRLLEQQGHEEEALHVYEELLDGSGLTAQERAEACYAMAYLLDRVGNFPESRQRLQGAGGAREPTWLEDRLRPVRLMDQGWATLLGKDKDWDEVLEIFRNAASLARAAGQEPSEGVQTGIVQALRKLTMYPEAAQALPSGEQMKRNGQFHLLEEAGWIALAMNENDVAADRFEAVLKEWPDSAMATGGRAAALINLDEYDAARELLDTYNGPDDAGILLARGQLDMNMRHYERAAEQFGLARDKQPDSDEAKINFNAAMRKLGKPVLPDQIENALLRMIDAGYDAVQSQDYEQALKKFEGALGQSQGDKYAQHGKFTALRGLGRLTEAEAYLLSIAGGTDWSRWTPTCRNELGRLRYGQHRYSEALKIFNDVFKDSADVTAIIWSVRTFRRLHKLAGAEERLAAAQSDGGDVLPEIKIEEGWLRYDQHRYDEALKAFASVYSVYRSTSPDAVGAKCAALRAMRDFDEVQQLLAEVARPGRQDKLLTVRLHKEWGWLAFYRHKYRDAVEFFREALQRAPDDADARLWLASAYRQSRDFELAAEVLKQGQSREVERTGRPNPALQREAGWLAYDKDEFNQALLSFQAASEADPSDTAAVCGVSETLQRLHHPGDGYLDIARNRVEAALVCYPDSILLQCELGLLLIAQGQFYAAREKMSEVLEADPSHDLALATMIRAQLGLCRDQRCSDRAQKDLRDLAERAERTRRDGREVRSALSEMWEYWGSEHDNPEALNKALDLVTGLVHEFGETPRILAFRARLLRKCNYKTDSGHLLELALQKFQSSTALARERAELERCRKHYYPEAVEWLDKALDWDPWQPDAWSRFASCCTKPAGGRRAQNMRPKGCRTAIVTAMSCW